MERQLEILKALCDLPTAPYCEQHVMAWLLEWAKGKGAAITARLDEVGNVYLEYGRAAAGRRTLVVEAHMDHPGFVAREQSGMGGGSLRAEFWGGVRPSHFEGARAKFWVNEPLAVGSVSPVAAKGKWVSAKVVEVKAVDREKPLAVTLEAEGEVPAGCIGMWDLPEAKVGEGDIFSARVCDDLAGVAAIVCLLEELIEAKTDAHVIGLLTRAEEVGFAGVLAICEKNFVAKDALVIGLETSKGLNFAPQGAGPIIRVGDRTGLFSPGLTHFLVQAAGHIADAAPADKPFKHQRKLMDGGMCSTTAFTAYGYDAAAMCICIGNYHNMHNEGETGWKQAPTAGPQIASETIHLGDFAGMVRILFEAVTRLESYRPNFAVVKDRLAKMYRAEQAEKLDATRPAK